MSRRAVCAASLSLVLAAHVPVHGGAQQTVPAVGNAAAKASVSLPDGPGVEVVRGHCISCHGADLIVGQRLTRVGWDREVAKMERWSRSVPSPDRERLLDYLAGHLGTAKGPAAAGGASGPRGREVHDRACLTCHDDGFTRAQRLTAAGWRRTVVKMVQWGAPVPSDDVDALVTFLTAPAGR